MDKIKDILKSPVKDDVKRIKKALDRYIINKKEKKELFKEIKNINKGEDSFDDGMVYFKLENSLITGIDTDCCVSCIIENEMGDRILTNDPPGREKIAIQTSNKIIHNIYSNKTMLENLISQALANDLDFENEPTIKQITAKEYYSLLD